MNISDFINGKLVFDVGCNMGRKTAEYQAAGATVIGFEPHAEMAMLCVRYQGNLVEVVALGSSKSKQPIWMSYDPATENYSHNLNSMNREFIDVLGPKRFSEYAWYKDPEYVDVDTLDNMIAKHGKPMYIKIDVEGYELEVLKGLTQPVEIVSIEYQADLINNTFACLDYLGQGKRYNIGVGENKDFLWYNWISRNEVDEYLHSVKDEWGDVYILTPPWIEEI